MCITEASVLFHISVLFSAMFCHFSTPKSTRQGLSSTPAPLASPILHVDGATPPCGIPLGYVKETPKFVAECNRTESPMLPLSAADTVMVCYYSNLSKAVLMQCSLSHI